ncbi:hypothetical protein HPB47_011011 [Ixodes persulcatus]|uniref:Uncharacterized protein n=1 Tax=Ixodes persulcatus TaxID=34615 RepID=A0AC60NXR5_IXOPE|nr:hypothetical protein HPB47_011011 [Ixodes persulcatus]
MAVESRSCRAMCQLNAQRWGISERESDYKWFAPLFILHVSNLRRCVGRALGRFDDPAAVSSSLGRSGRRGALDRRVPMRPARRCQRVGSSLAGCNSSFLLDSFDPQPHC